MKSTINSDVVASEVYEEAVMRDKAMIIIDCDEGTITVEMEKSNLIAIPRQIEITKAELVATILAMQSRELMAMSKHELMARHLVMLEK